MVALYIIVSLISFYLLVGFLSFFNIEFFGNGVQEAYCILLVIIIGILVSIDTQIRKSRKSKSKTSANTPPDNISSDLPSKTE